jgi:hypothetical protein
MADGPTGALARRHHQLVRPGGGARSTSTTTFEGEHLTWSDLPAPTRRAARHRTPVVVDQAVADDTLYQLDADLVQVMRAWRAHRDRLYLAVAYRVVQVHDEDVRPAGPWLPASLVQHDAVGEPRRRVGWVPPGDGSSPLSGRPGTAGAGSRVADAPPVPSAPPEHQAAARVWAYLPPPVRAGVARSVPMPDDWLGELVQTSSLRHLPLAQSIVMLRRDAETSVVIKATRSRDPERGSSHAELAARLAASDWLVEQVVMTTARPALLEAARAEDAWPWM